MKNNACKNFHVCSMVKAILHESSTSAYSVGKQARLGIQYNRWFSFFIFFLPMKSIVADRSRILQVKSRLIILSGERRKLRVIENGVAPSSTWCCPENCFFSSGSSGFLYHSDLLILLEGSLGLIDFSLWILGCDEGIGHLCFGLLLAVMSGTFRFRLFVGVSCKRKMALYLCFFIYWFFFVNSRKIPHLHGALFIS